MDERGHEMLTGEQSAMIDECQYILDRVIRNLESHADNDEPLQIISMYRDLMEIKHTLTLM